MPLTILGGDPPRKPTHKPVDFGKLASLGMDVEELADGEPLELGALLEHAAEQGQQPSHLLVAAALTTDVRHQSQSVTFTVCAGACQQYGALEAIDHLCDRWERRHDAGKSVFAIQPKRCMDRCLDGPMVSFTTADGVAVLPRATVAQLDEALDALD